MQMRDIIAVFPDVDTLLALEPELLGAKLLFIIRGRTHTKIRGRTETKFNTSSMKNDLVNSQQNQPTYPPNKLDDVVLALSEAFAWLEAQGLIVHAAEG